MRKLITRLEQLEARGPEQNRGMPFLWCWRQTLDDALTHAWLTLEQKLVAICLVPPNRVSDPKWEMDQERFLESQSADAS